MYFNYRFLLKLDSTIGAYVRGTAVKFLDLVFFFFFWGWGMMEKHRKFAQGYFTWEELWGTSIHLCKVCWNENLASYVYLISQCEVDTNYCF